jgi:hypothetical protein
MLNAQDCPGGRWTQPQFPSIPFSIPPAFADGREHGDTGRRGRSELDAQVLDFVTEPLDSSGCDRSFRC